MIDQHVYEQMRTGTLEAASGMGCIIMASGMAKRFGSNKLLTDWAGEPMIARILKSTEGLFEKRVVVTRHKEVEALCKEKGVHAVLHDYPNRNDTVRIGMEYLWEQLGEGMNACMFCQSDQPLLRKASLLNIIDQYKEETGTKPNMYRLAYGDEVGTPVLFPAWTFQELRKLPEKKGGGYLLKKYPDRVKTVQAASIYELKDVDTPEELEALLLVNK